MTGNSANSDDITYTARLEVRVRDLEMLVGQQGDELTQLLGIVAELAASTAADVQIGALRDRHEQLVARVRILEQSAGG